MCCTFSWLAGCCNSPVWALQLTPGLRWQSLVPHGPLLVDDFSGIFSEAAVSLAARHALCAARAELVFAPPLHGIQHT